MEADITLSRSKISDKADHDFTDVTIDADEEFVHYKIKRVTGGESTLAQGTLIEEGDVAPTLSHTITITDDELMGSGGLEGDNIVKAFVRGEPTYISEETFISESTFISDGVWSS